MAAAGAAGAGPAMSEPVTLEFLGARVAALTDELQDLKLISTAELTALAARLFPPPITRWTIRRKAAVAAAILLKRLTFEEACQRYEISAEEVALWITTIERHGLAGLRVTLAQSYRPQSYRQKNQ
jgi:Protein of unknown function (DUF1153)